MVKVLLLFSSVFYYCSSKIEVKVLDYQTQQGKVLPLLATAYVFSFTNQYLIRMYLDIKNSVIKHSEESLDEVSYVCSRLLRYSFFGNCSIMLLLLD